MTAWQPSSGEQIKQYYDESFVPHLDDMPRFITPDGPIEYGLALVRGYPHGDDNFSNDWVRRNTRIPGPDKGDPLAREKDQRPVFVDRDGNPSLAAVGDFIQRPDKHDPRQTHDPTKGLTPPEDRTGEEPGPEAVTGDFDRQPLPAHPVPEAVYYRLMNYEYHWVLAFDIDAKDIAHWRLAPEYDDIEGREAILEAAGVANEAPEGYLYTFADIDRAISYAFQLSEWLADKLGVDEFLHVYSGQGMHVYVMDEERWTATKQSRELLKDHIRECERFKIPVDPVVTQGRARLMRLPYSLHADVSRICQPIRSPEFDPRTDRLPRFLDADAERPLSTTEALVSYAEGAPEVSH